MAEGPVPPICDLDCQKKRKLDALKIAKDNADTAYTTASKGHGAIASQKESTARDEAEKTIRNYTQQYSLLTTSAPKKETQDVTELHKEVEKEKTQTDILNRLAQFTNVPVSFDWIGILMDVIIAVLGLCIAYLVFSRFMGSATDAIVESSDVTI